MEIGNITISLDNRWELNDFATFTKEYVDLYSFYYTLAFVQNDIKSQTTFTSYPWEGGYSVVNFFQKTYGLIRRGHRLRIIKIQYSSPGVIELSGVISIAQDISILVGAICASAYAINRTYDSIKASYIKRKLARLKIKEMESKLKRDDIDFINQSVKKLSEDFRLNPEQVQSLSRITKGNKLIQLKMLLALYRRAELIAKQQTAGKTRL
ncbi:MAG: hypothetical protein JW787_14620 [Sedimentisphaerales bacterium]|nr:hypothetical protein [Sedimentisphaerales bacterium]